MFALLCASVAPAAAGAATDYVASAVASATAVVAQERSGGFIHLSTDFCTPVSYTHLTLPTNREV